MGNFATNMGYLDTATPLDPGERKMKGMREKETKGKERRIKGICGALDLELRIVEFGPESEPQVEVPSGKCSG